MVAVLTQAPAKNRCGHSGVPTQFSILPECSLVCRLVHGKCVVKDLLCDSSCGHVLWWEHRSKGIFALSLFTDIGWLVLIYVEPEKIGHRGLHNTISMYTFPPCQLHLCCNTCTLVVFSVPFCLVLHQAGCTSRSLVFSSGGSAASPLLLLPGCTDTVTAPCLGVWNVGDRTPPYSPSWELIH